MLTMNKKNNEAVNMYKIPVYQPYLIGNEKKYVSECIDSGWISSKGEFVTRFESDFSKYISHPYVTSVCNGTVALHLALATLGLKTGDEVIVPTLTYIASVNTIIQTGATPVFVDSLPDSWNIDPEDVKRKISNKTKAIMAVHLYGLPCDMSALSDICREYNLLLIEDCAEAFGTFYNEQHVGTFGDVATFSFFGNKTITTGEGGMVVTKSDSLLEIAKHLKNQGVSRSKEYWHDTCAYNYRMTNVSAAIGVAQLEQINLILQKKRNLATFYSNALSDLPVIFHKEKEKTIHSYWMCSILAESTEVRMQLRDYLSQCGIETRPLFYPAHTMPHCFQDGFYPVAQSLSERGINLPSWPGLSNESTLFICSSIKNFFQTLKN